MDFITDKAEFELLLLRERQLKREIADLRDILQEILDSTLQPSISTPVQTRVSASALSRAKELLEHG